MLVKTLDTKTAFGDKAAIQRLVLSDEKAKHFLYRVAGRIEGFMQGKSKQPRTDKETGEISDNMWTRFSGDFYAINCREENFESATCFLPPYISGPMRRALEADPEATPSFRFDIYAVYNKDSATSYEYIAQPVRDVGDDGGAAKRLLMGAAPLPNKVLTAPEEKT